MERIREPSELHLEPFNQAHADEVRRARYPTQRTKCIIALPPPPNTSPHMQGQLTRAKGVDEEWWECKQMPGQRKHFYGLLISRNCFGGVNWHSKMKQRKCFYWTHSKASHLESSAVCQRDTEFTCVPPKGEGELAHINWSLSGACVSAQWSKRVTQHQRILSASLLR